VAPADSVAIVLQYLARLRRGSVVAERHDENATRVAAVATTVALGGRAGALLRDSLAARPLPITDDEAPLRTLVVDSLVFRDTLATLHVTTSGSSGRPGPWWENVQRLVYRWDASAGEWRLAIALLSRSTDGSWSFDTAPRRPR
jgi:hypothetical protein